MLSLLRWTLGTGDDHLTEPEKVKVAEKSNPRPRPPKTKAMPANPAKRKRGNSAHTAGAHLHRAPAPPAPAPVAPPRAPQYLSHVEVAVQNAKNAVARRPSSASPAAVMAHNATNVAMNGYFPPTYQPADRPDAMDWQAAAAPSAPRRGSAVPPKAAKPPPLPSAAAAADPAVSAAASEAARMTELQQVIATEFDLEILLKHDELRLIDQEIAKCQVALEQLRRCSVIPYPSQTAAPDDMVAVSAGAGAPLRRRSGGQPESAPPWGVVDGPYSRHYARWLLPDPIFDGESAGHDPGLSAAKQAGADPKHRAVAATARAEKAVPSPKVRPHRGSGALRLQALPAGYPEPKEAKGPMVLRRAADGKYVKLVCVDCHREDFSSPQGFINHCRIAHSRNLPSHEAAAQVCGQEIEANAVDTAAGTGAEPGVAAPATPATAGPTVSTPVTAGSALVHPFIKNSHLPTRVPMLSKPPPPRIPHGNEPTVFSASIPPNNHNHKSDTPFVPSTQAPHLSQLLARAGGRGVDLQALIAEATTHEDLDAVGSEESDYEEDEGDEDAMETDDSHADHAANPPSTFRPAQPLRQPSRGVRGGPTHSPVPPTPDTPDARDTGRKGPERASRRPGGMRVGAAAHHLPPTDPSSSSQAATAPAAAAAAAAAAPLSSTPAAASLSPHTAPSAPSLVSDRGDDDDEDYASHATRTSAGDASSDADAADPTDEDVGADDMDVDVDLRSAGASTVAGDEEEPGASDDASPAPPVGRGVGGRSLPRAVGAAPDPELGASGKAREQGRRRAVGRGRGGRRRGGK